MTPSHVSIYCLPNVRAPWVVVYEPHPWGHGALRVGEDKAVLVYTRAATRFERDWLADAVCHYCRTFATLEGLLDYEDGQHERAAEVREAVACLRRRVDAVLAEVAEKQRKKRAARRRNRTPP